MLADLIHFFLRFRRFGENNWFGCGRSGRRSGEWCENIAVITARRTAGETGSRRLRFEFFQIERRWRSGNSNFSQTALHRNEGFNS